MEFIGGPCQTANLTQFKTPWGLTVTINKALVPRFERACQEAFNNPWKPKRIDSYNCRQIRGSSAWSRHAYGVAFDFFDKPWPEPVDVWGHTNSPSPSFAAVFEKYGFTWGAKWSRADYPHIEWSDDAVPPLIEKEWDEMATKEEIQAIVRREVDEGVRRVKEELVRQRKILAVGEERAYDPSKVNIQSAIKD